MRTKGSKNRNLTPDQMRSEVNLRNRERYATDTEYREKIKKDVAAFRKTYKGRACIARQNRKITDKAFIEYLNCCKPKIETKQEKLTKEILDENK